ncbi:hypothetical protein ACS0TY_017259 [Phlomoides rotata]
MDFVQVYLPEKLAVIFSRCCLTNNFYVACWNTVISSGTICQLESARGSRISRRCQIRKV